MSMIRQVPESSERVMSGAPGVCRSDFSHKAGKSGVNGGKMEIMHSTMAPAARIANKQLSFFSHKTRTKAKLWLKYGNSYEILTRVAL